jgi:hypothetical protein
MGQGGALTMNNPKQLSPTREFRATIRLILLRKVGGISDAEWADVRALHTVNLQVAT